MSSLKQRWFIALVTYQGKLCQDRDLKFYYVVDHTIYQQVNPDSIFSIPNWERSDKKWTLVGITVNGCNKPVIMKRTEAVKGDMIDLWHSWETIRNMIEESDYYCSSSSSDDSDSSYNSDSSDSNSGSYPDSESESDSESDD